jgi:aspartyl-tRNA(Asn)/glutamyl-tRNA(Gln) amidotransferase subunit A
MCDWAIGSDTGGSIRIPASLCGVAGFKPAFGSIEMGGVIPLSRSLDTLGPLAPDIATATRAYTMMSGEAVSLDDLEPPRLAVPAGWVSGLDEPTSRAWERVSRGLPEIEFIDRERLYRVGQIILLVEAAAYHRKWVTESPEKYGADVLGHLQRGLGILAVDFEEPMLVRPQLAEEASRAMQGIDALLLPATAIVAPPIDSAIDVREPLSRFTRPFNTTHQPVAVLPAPTHGLPVGMQVVGHSNAATLRAARWLEREWASASGL